MDRSECVHGILHCLPACVREVRPRESFRSWECEASSHRFSINGLLPQKRREDARTRRAGCGHSKSPATAGRNTTHKNLRKLATASSSCGELRKLSSIVVRISRIPRLSFRAKSPAKPELYAKVWRNLPTYFRYCRLATRARLQQLGRFFFAALDLHPAPA